MAMAGSALEQQVLAIAQAMEEQVDRQLEAKKAEVEEMDDDDAIEAIRVRRIAEMKEQNKKRQEWRCAGHGEYSELSEKEFFDAVKKSDRMVVHFYRPSTWRSKILDKHLLPLAQAHQETRFVMINVEKAHFLVEKLNIRILPSVVLINGNHTQHTIQGFDELGGTDDFSLTTLEECLEGHGVIFPS